MNSHPTRDARGKSPGIRLALTCILLLMSGLNSYAAPAAPDAAGFAVVTLPPEALSAPIDLAQARPASDNPKMDADLADLASAGRTSVAQALELAQSSALNVAGDRVQVKITVQPQNIQDITQAVVAAGGEVTGSANGDTWLQAWLPVNALDALAAEGNVEFISRPAEAILRRRPKG